MPETSKPQHTSPPEFVFLHWVDSRGGGHWFDKEDYKPRVSNCIAAGIVIAETNEYITLVGAMSDPTDEDVQYYAPMSIPKPCITFRRRMVAQEADHE